MKIAIIGTRGIPNHYGGFEQLAAYLAVGLQQNGHAVTVYNSHNHPYREKQFRDVNIVHCYDAESWLGTAGQFVYDFNCIWDARNRNFDVLLLLGYTSSSVWGRLYPKETLVISNMDGLEWRRSKYSWTVKNFLKYAEKLAVKYSDYCIADSISIKQYIDKKYKIQTRFIPYGAEIFQNEDESLLAAYGLKKKEYYLLMARMEKENNIEMVLDGFHKSQSDKFFLVIGHTGNKFGKYLIQKFRDDKRIMFTGAVYDAHATHSLKAFCLLYFHGHSVGGTNPSLLEAMASRALIAAHGNEFNKNVLGQDAYYFTTSQEVKAIIEADGTTEKGIAMVKANLEKIKHQYNWPAVISAYHDFITSTYNSY